MRTVTIYEKMMIKKQSLLSVVIKYAIVIAYFMGKSVEKQRRKATGTKECENRLCQPVAQNRKLPS